MTFKPAVATGAGTDTADLVLTGAGTDTADLVLTGAVAGAAVGAAQSALLPSGRLAWTAVTASAWALAWLISSAVPAQQSGEGFVVFGSSGALIATALTGLALRRAVVA